MNRLILLLFVLCTLASPPSSTAGESQLDPGTARSLPFRLRSIFGPASPKLRYDERMIRAAEIATERAHRQTTWKCWRYVKYALLEAGVISTRPTTAWAKQAGEELTREHGFKKLDIRDPRRAPVGAVVVYGGRDAGHVELRTVNGFVSDFFSKTPYPRPLIGVYVKES